MKYVYMLMFILISSMVSAAAYGGVMLQEGQTKTFYSATQDYNLRVLAVTDTREEVIFELNGERSKPLKEREKHQFSDGSVVSVADVLVNEGGENTGGDLVSFYFVSGKMETMAGQGVTYIEDAEYDLGRLAEDFSQIVEPKYARITFTDSELECIGDGNCDDKDACSVDKCVNGECLHDFRRGCSAGGRCIGIQEITENGAGERFYCSIGGLVKQKEDGLACDNDFECINLCLNGECAEEEFIEVKIEAPSSDVGPIQQEWLFTRFFRWLIG